MAALFGVVLVAVCSWQFAGVTGQQQRQVLDPELALVWKLAVVGLLAAGAVCSLVVWARRRWVMSLAVVNAAVNWLAAATIVGLTVEGELFAPATSASLAELAEPFIVVVIAVAVWDSWDGISRARRA